MNAKEQKRYDRHFEKAKEYQLTTLVRKTATSLQKAIRAEAGAYIGHVKAVENGEIRTVFSPLGYAVCITCATVKPWKGQKNLGQDGVDAGHFLASRRNSILLDERGIHPQCTYCNRTGGKPEAYQLYMLDQYGQDVIDDLHRLKNQVSRTFTRDELVTMRLEYMDRASAAEKTISRKWEQ